MDSIVKMYDLIVVYSENDAKSARDKSLVNYDHQPNL